MAEIGIAVELRHHPAQHRFRPIIHILISLWYIPWYEQVLLSGRFSFPEAKNTKVQADTALLLRHLSEVCYANASCRVVAKKTRQGDRVFSATAVVHQTPFAEAHKNNWSVVDASEAHYTLVC